MTTTTTRKKEMIRIRPADFDRMNAVKEKTGLSKPLAIAFLLFIYDGLSEDDVWAKLRAFHASRAVAQPDDATATTPATRKPRGHRRTVTA